MDLALTIAKSGLEAHHKNVEIISNNLANSNTTAFKKGRAEFADLPYQTITEPGSPTTSQTNADSGVILGTGTKLVSTEKIFTDGSQIQTDNALDVAISGRGFLKVQMPNSSDFVYTRAGSLHVNAQGQVTLPNGYLVQPAITIPPGVQNVTIGEDGTVNVLQPGNPTPQQVGQLTLTDFINPDGLLPLGDNLYAVTNSSGTPTDGTPGLTGLGTLRQGALEGSNVNVVEEMVNLIEAQRAFEVTSKAVSTVDNMLQYITHET